MTDKNETDTAKPVSNNRTRGLVPFKKGYDKRRWLNGRGKKSPEQREGDEILRAVIWEELSREFDARENLKPLESAETIDALRLMVRGWIKKKPNEVAERIAGKVTQNLDLTSGGKALTRIEIVMPNEPDEH